LTDARQGTDGVRPLGAQSNDGRHRARQSLHADDPVARAVARRILARLGIPPLLAFALLLTALPGNVDAREGAPSSIRAVATARVVVVSDAARLRAGTLTRTAPSPRDPRDASPPPLSKERSCEVADPAGSACRMIVIDLY
jgi:hypothetical protein